MTGNLFYFIFSFEIRIVDCFFNVFICHPGPCDQIVGPFRGSCCVKITKNSSNSIFLEPFDLIITVTVKFNLLFLFPYEIRIFDCLFIFFICHPGPCDQFLGPFRGLCCVKITKNSLKSIFLVFFT